MPLTQVQPGMLGTPQPYNFKNRIINGAMVITQRNGTSSVTIPAATVTYTLDRWAAFGSAASKFSVQQDAGTVTPPAGFTDYLGVTSLSAYTVGSSEGFWVRQPIEGFNIADLGWGTVNAQTVTLSFWVRSSLTGTFGGSLVDNFTPLSYPFSYTISTANTWEKKSITIIGPTSGTFPTNNTAGLYMIFGLGNGSTVSGTAGSWQSANLQNVTGAVSVVGTNGATWYMTGCQFEVGVSATTFDYRPYTTELQLCQRYYYQWNSTAYQGGGFTSFVYVSSLIFTAVPFPVTMRIAPVLASVTASNFQILTNSGGSAPSSITLVGASPTDASLSIATSGATGGQACILWGQNTSAKLQFSSEL